MIVWLVLAWLVLAIGLLVWAFDVWLEARAQDVVTSEVERLHPQDD